MRPGPKTTPRRSYRLRLSPASWILVATAIAGALNYFFALSMTGLLTPSQYSVFAGALATTLVAGTVANTSVPWLLAREISHPEQGSSARGIVWFATVLNFVVGMLAAALAVFVTAGFAGGDVMAWLGFATLGFFMASTGMGWAQGHERFGLLAVLIVAEVAIKVATGIPLVALGAGPAGAFAAALIGALVITLAMLRPMWGELGPSIAALGSRRLWRAAAGMGAVQGLVTLLSVIDVLFISVRLGPSRVAASYQLAATLTRAPLFIALALATAAFPQLVRRAGERATLSAHLQHVLTVLVPLLVVVASVPDSLLTNLLPAGYGGAVRFVPLTAAISTAYGLVVVQTTVFRAAGRARECIAILACACVASLGFMAAGAELGVYGLAAGALVGGLSAVGALAIQTERHWHGAQRPRLRPLLIWPVVAVALIAAREVPWVWLCAACLIAAYVARAALSPPEHTAASSDIPHPAGVDEDGGPSGGHEAPREPNSAPGGSRLAATLGTLEQ